MENLNVLSQETLISIIYQLDEELSNVSNKDLEKVNLQIMLNKAYNDLSEMNNTRQYWKDMALDYKQQLKDAGLIKQIKREVATEVIVKPKKEFTINVRHKKDVKDFTPGTSDDPNYRPGNYKGTKHRNGSFSKDSGEVLQGINIETGDIFQFENGKEAKDYLRKLGLKGKFTNLYRAARKSGVYKHNNGKAYKHIWSYETKEEELLS